MKEHIKKMTEVFGELVVIADPVSEEDKVVHLLASLPDAYNVLVTALESGSENVPPLETVTERQPHCEKLFPKAELIGPRSLFFVLTVVPRQLRGLEGPLAGRGVTY